MSPRILQQGDRPVDRGAIDIRIVLPGDAQQTRGVEMTRSILHDAHQQSALGRDPHAAGNQLLHEGRAGNRGVFLQSSQLRLRRN